MPKKVLYVSAVFPHARGVKWTSALQGFGFDVVALCGRGPRMNAWMGETPLLVESIPGLDSKMLVSLSTMRKVLHRAQIHRPNLILVQDIFLAGYALYVAKVLRLPCFIDVADNYPEVLESIVAHPVRRRLLSTALNAWEGFVLKRATGVVFVSRESMKYIIRKHKLDKSRAFIVENVPAALVPARSRSEKRFKGRLVYIGTFDEGIRDLETVIRGLEEYELQFQEEATLTVFTFNVEEVTRFLQRLGRLSRRVRVYPVVESAALQDTLGDFDVGVVPHRRCPGTEYTVPNKLFDYLYCGLPVLCSDNPPLKRVLTEVGGGVCYACGDPTDFARALRRLKEDIEHGQNRANADLLATNYSWHNQVVPLLDHFRSCATSALCSRQSPSV